MVKAMVIAAVTPAIIPTIPTDIVENISDLGRREVHGSEAYLGYSCTLNSSVCRPQQLTVTALAPGSD